MGGYDVKTKLDQDGVVVIEGFLSPGEADELKQAAKDLEAQRPVDEISVFTTNESKNSQYHDTYFIESNDKIRYFEEAEEVDSQKKRLNKVGHALHWLHPLFRFYTFSDRVKQACLALHMKDPAVVQSMVIYKPAGVGGEVKPHQDATYLSTEPETAIGFWIALEDATTENGCLWVARGSHRSGVHRRLRRTGDDSGPFLDYDRPQPLYPDSNFTPLAIAKGDCIIIHGQVVHKSGPNKSRWPRPAYTFHVVEKDSKFAPDNWLQPGPAAPFVSLYTTSQTP